MDHDSQQLVGFSSTLSSCFQAQHLLRTAGKPCLMVDFNMRLTEVILETSMFMVNRAKYFVDRKCLKMSAYQVIDDTMVQSFNLVLKCDVRRFSESVFIGIVNVS